MKVIFISGKYRDIDWDAVERNIQKAKDAAVALAKQGWMFYCPHTHTAHMEDLYDEQIWVNGNLEMLKRCDAIYVLDNWESSEGAKCEIEFARTIKRGKEQIPMPVYYQDSGLPTPSGGIIKQHHCQGEICWEYDWEDRIKTCIYCGYRENMEKPLTNNVHSFPHQFARIK